MLSCKMLMCEVGDSKRKRASNKKKKQRQAKTTITSGHNVSQAHPHTLTKLQTEIYQIFDSRVDRLV